MSQPSPTADDPKFEYQEAHALFRHYDALSIHMAAFLFPIAFALLAASFATGDSAPLSARQIFAVVLSSMALIVYGAWIAVDRRLTFYTHTLLERLGELEEILHLQIHSRLQSRDRWYGTLLKIRHVLYGGAILLILIWVLRLVTLFMFGY